MPSAKRPDDSSPHITDHPLYTTLRPQLAHNLPIAVHLNADTSWLLLLPYPRSAFSSSSPSSPPPAPAYLKILIDPWFTGYSDDSALFRTLLYAEQHNIPPAVQTISELEAILTELSKHEGQLQLQLPDLADSENLSSAASSGGDDDYSHRQRTVRSPIDAVIVSNDNGDHCHGPTLRQLHPSVPVLALPLPAKVVRGYGYFETVHVVREFESCVSGGDASSSRRSVLGSLLGAKTLKPLDWRLATYDLLPRWLGVAYAVTPGEYPAFHTPLMIAFQAERAMGEEGLEGEGRAHAVFYMPHGAPVKALAPFRRAEPAVETLAVLTGLHRVWLTAGLLRIAEGARGAMDLVKELRPKYWLATHDEVKETTAKGLIVPVLLRREENGVEDTIEIAQRKGLKGRIVSSGNEMEEGDIKLLQPGSGASCILGEVQQKAIRFQP